MAKRDWWEKVRARHARRLAVYWSWPRFEFSVGFCLTGSRLDVSVYTPLAHVAVEVCWRLLDRNQAYLGPWVDLYLLGLNVDLDLQHADLGRWWRE